VVFGGILLLLADRFLLAGIIMAVVCGVSWVVVPVLRLVHYLTTDQKLDRRRLRAVGVCAGVILAVAAFLYFCPFPSNFKSPGVVMAKEDQIVVNRVGGDIVQVMTPSGTRVHAGEPLLRMENRELDLQIQELEAKLSQVEAERQRALRESVADVKSVDGVLDSIHLQLRKLRAERDTLLVSADIPGVWVAPSVNEFVGTWIPRGTPVGQIVDDESFYFSSVVSQREVSRVFSGEIRSAEVRLYGQAERGLRPGSFIRIPMEQTSLPSAALGLGAGGEVAVSVTDTSGTRAAESFYEVRLDLPRETARSLFHGQSGKALFRLPAEPLLKQGWRALRQLVQERYKL
jgi:putative peptide zinc metalloprotease protein